MPPRLPRKLSGNSPRDVEWNALVDYLMSTRGLEGPGTLTTVSPFGTSRASKPSRASVQVPSQAQTGGTQRFRVKSVQGDYLTCRTLAPYYVTAVAITSAGAGYTVGAIYTVPGGTSTTAATVRVDAVNDGGGITALSLVNPGSYTVAPPTTFSLPFTGVFPQAGINLTLSSGENPTDILVAKPPALRHSLTSQNVDGTTWTFSYQAGNSNPDGVRRCYVGANQNIEWHEVVPVYVTNNTWLAEIWADQPVGGTGVFVGGTQLVWMDTNRDGRAWCQYA